MIEKKNNVAITCRKFLFCSATNKKKCDSEKTIAPPPFKLNRCSLSYLRRLVKNFITITTIEFHVPCFKFVFYLSILTHWTVVVVLWWQYSVTQHRSKTKVAYDTETLYYVVLLESVFKLQQVRSKALYNKLNTI